MPDMEPNDALRRMGDALRRMGDAWRAGAEARAAGTAGWNIGTPPPPPPRRGDTPLAPANEMEQMLAWVLERMGGGWRDEYRQEHGFDVGQGNNESERDAVANLIWSGQQQQATGQGPSQEQWEQHYQGYQSGQDDSWEQYLAMADAILGFNAAPAPVESIGADSGVPMPPGPYDRNPLTDPNFDVPLRDRDPRVSSSGSSGSSGGSSGSSGGSTSSRGGTSSGGGYALHPEFDVPLWQRGQYGSGPTSSTNRPTTTTTNPRGSGPDSDIPLSQRESVPAPAPYRASSGAYDYMIPGNNPNETWRGGLATNYAQPEPARSPKGLANARDNRGPRPTSTPAPTRTVAPTPVPSPSATPRAMNQRAQDEARRQAIMRAELMRHVMREGVPPVPVAPRATGTPTPFPTPSPYTLPRNTRR